MKPLLEISKKAYIKTCIYRPVLGPRPQRQLSSGIDPFSRMGEEIMLGIQNLRSMIDTRSSSYGGGSDYSSSGGYEEGCCNKLDFHTFVPGFVLVAVSYFLFFLLNATVTSGRRRRMVTSSKEEEESK